jgi:hypothetical protein
MENWAYEGNFLEQFSGYERNIVTQAYCRAYRGVNPVYITAPEADKAEAQTLEQMLERLDKEITDRCAQDWISVEMRVALSKLMLVFRSDESKEFARFIAKREKRPPEDKAKAKEAAKEVYVQKAMAAKPPSMKQLALLKKLGVEIAPASMSEASMLIDRALKK